jgi:hypothetical protein
MARIEVEKKPAANTTFWSWVLLLIILAIVVWIVVDLVQ